MTARIIKMRLNGIENPIGYDTSSLSFSWIVEGTESKFQKSARLIISADSNCDINKKEELIHDSGESSKINSPYSTVADSPYSTKHNSPNSIKSNSPKSTSASFKEFEERQRRYVEQRENKRKEAEQKIIDDANRSYTLPKSKKLYKNWTYVIMTNKFFFFRTRLNKASLNADYFTTVLELKQIYSNVFADNNELKPENIIIFVDY